MLKNIDDPAERAALIIASSVAVIASIVLIGGWLLDIPQLRTMGPHWTAMAPLTAVLLILLSAGIIAFERRRALSNILLLVTFVLAAAVLMDYLLGVDLGVHAVSEVLQTNDRGGAPELPAPDAAAAVMMLALALGCLRTHSKHLHDFADVITAVVGIICIQVLIGYAYSVSQSGMFTGFRQIAPHSTLAVLLLAAATTARRRTPGMFTALSGSEQSALLLRRLVPITLVLCIIVGWLHLIALREGVGGTVPEIVSWTVTGAVVVLSLLLFVTSAEMRKVEATVRRRQEELLAATQAAEAASEAKSRFMGVMSHELRTPLTAMIGYADLLDAGLAGELTSEGKAYMHRIRASGWHLVGLIDAVLFYTGGKLPAEHATSARVDLGALLREMIAMFAAPANDKNLAIEFDPPRQPIHIDVDERKLRQILTNLLSNAVKFTEHGSIFVKLRGTADTAHVEVRDTGIGIDAENLKRIWEPFQLIDASHTRTQGGMGLGLALTRRLTEQLGARISAVSAPGIGATFTLELPRSDSPDRGQLELQAVRILVVDDEPTVRRIMARSLSRHGAEVTEADSAYEAMKVIDEQTPDVLVTDISMPGMTGIELGERIRAQELHIPILFVTGAELDMRDQAGIAALRATLLKKPFDMSDLARTVRSLMDQRTTATS